MGFFDDDGFFGSGIDDLFKQLTGEGGFTEYSSVGPDGKRRTYRKSFAGERGIPAKQVLTKKNIFLIFDFSGEKDVKVEVKDNLVKNEYGEKVYTGKKVLEISSSKGVIGEYVLSDKMRVKGFETSFVNGILEVKFKK